MKSYQCKAPVEAKGKKLIPTLSFTNYSKIKSRQSMQIKTLTLMCMSSYEYFSLSFVPRVVWKILSPVGMIPAITIKKEWKQKGKICLPFQNWLTKH